ncbi:MAG: helix-turn-helix domain-containing protein [Pseudobdellovibrionaceae bacterium]
MNIFYDNDTDYLEVFFKKESNFSDELSKFVTVFKSEETDEVVGYGFENASHTVFESGYLNVQAKLAALLKMARTKEDLTQDQAAKKIGDITLRHYQRLESGEENTTLSMIESAMNAFPKVDFSKLLKRVS